MISRAGTVNLSTMPVTQEEALALGADHLAQLLGGLKLADANARAEEWKVTTFSKTPLVRINSSNLA